MLRNIFKKLFLRSWIYYINIIVLDNMLFELLNLFDLSYSNCFESF